MGSGDVIPTLSMILVQLGYAGMTITSKLSIQSGMNPLVLVAYRQLFATAFIAPFAFWLERKTVCKLTVPITFQILLCSLTGVTVNQILYFVGLKYSTATIASALTNLLPAFTFILAVLTRQECVRIKTKAGQAMVLGTVLGIGGALFLSFYHGKAINLGRSGIHWEYAEKNGQLSSISKTNTFFGPLLVIGSALIWALWFVIQANLCRKYPAPYKSTAYMCFLASMQCVAIALCVERQASAWSLANSMRLTSALYAGIVCTGVACCLMSWTIERKGALFVSVFSPLQAVIAAIVSWALLQEKLHAGTAIGSVMIVLGLYSVLWGKSHARDIIQKTEEEASKRNGIGDGTSNNQELQQVGRHDTAI
ncbi:WAT1-related protein At1g09380-like [Prosopis cineraria]|uniref:WAT1-related protein At1g09380-like n=1 Tax=Prosopis cineraria TaxID=364024 RepID=UPI00240EBC13|nr:WAT1-related protein At1g09380-like [Prosopis cineraria]